MSSIGGKPSPSRWSRKHGRWRRNNTFRLETMFPSHDEVVITLPLMSPIQTTTRFVTSMTGASTPNSSSSALSASSARSMSTLETPSLEASSRDGTSWSSSASTLSATSTSRSSMASSRTLKRSLLASDGPSPIPSTASVLFPTTLSSSTSSSTSASVSSSSASCPLRAIGCIVSSVLDPTSTSTSTSSLSASSTSSTSSSSTHVASSDPVTSSIPVTTSSASISLSFSGSPSFPASVSLTTPLSTTKIPSSHSSSSIRTPHRSSSTRTTHKSPSTRTLHKSTSTHTPHRSTSTHTPHRSSPAHTPHRSSSTHTSHKSSSTRTSFSKSASPTTYTHPPSSTATSPTTTQHTYTSTHSITSNGSGTTTVSNVVSSGSLSTGVSTSDNNPFTHSPGAIIGLAFGAAIAMAVVGVWIYVALRRNKQRRISELSASAANVTGMPEGGWLPPLDYGDDEGIPPANYAGLLASLGEIGEDQPYDPAQPSPGLGEGSEEGMSSDHTAHGSDHGHGGGRAPSLYSHHSSSRSRRHPYMTGFGQAAETMREDQPMMAMADGALPISPLVTASTTPEDADQDPSSWLGGRELGSRPRSGPSPFGSQSSSQGPLSSQGQSSPERYPKWKASSDEEPFATYLMRSSSQTQASSSSDIGSSSGHRRSVDANRQNSVPPVPPTNFSYNKRNGPERSMKGILGRLRGDRASTTRPKSVRNRGSYGKSRSISPPPFMFGPPIIEVRAPTPRSTSSLSQPPSPDSTPPGDITWPGREVLEAPGLISPSTSLGDSRAEGLLDPMLLWRLTQTRVDSSTSLRDNEDYTRPLGQLTVHNSQHSFSTVDTDVDKTR